MSIFKGMLCVKKIIFILLMVSGFSPFIYAASFDCSKAGTDIEHLICDNAKLSLLGETLASRYKDAMEYSVSKNNIKKGSLSGCHAAINVLMFRA